MLVSNCDLDVFVNEPGEIICVLNTNGFRYRDWIVAAFNVDMPYDNFVRMQIAGDLIGTESESSYGHGIVELSFGGFRPMNGCCAMSTTWPLTGPLSSSSQYTAAAAISFGQSKRPDGA